MQLFRSTLSKFRGDLREYAIGGLALLCGAVGILGRYSWQSTELPYSFRGAALSLFFLFLALPVLYYLVLEFSGSRRTAAVTFFFALIVCAIPYHLLGLDRFYYSLDDILIYFKEAPLPSPDWFPRSSANAVVPHEALFFLGILTSGFLVAWATAKNRTAKVRSTVFFFFALFCIVVVETWLHQSFRSPYTYIPHYERPASDHYWYHYFLFPNLSGAVNGDYRMFSVAEEAFIGAKRLVDPIAIRIFPFFISSQFTRFFNPYYVWIVMNVACWLLGVGAIYLVAREWFSVRASRIAAFLLAVAQGPIVYAAQPKPYVFGMIEIVLMLAIYLRLFQKKTFRPRNAVVFGGFFTLFLLTYDHQPWLIALPLIAWLSGRNVKRTIGVVLVALAVSAAFLQLCRQLPMMTVTGTVGGVHPMTSIKALIHSGDVVLWLSRVWQMLVGFTQCMFAAFQVLFPIAIVCLATMEQKARKVVLIFFLPAFMTYALFGLAGGDYVNFPRLTYSAYVGVFLLAGWGLDKVMAWRPGSLPRAGFVTATIFLVCQAGYSNLDVFGHPWIYFYWFYNRFGYSW